MYLCCHSFFSFGERTLAVSFQFFVGERFRVRFSVRSPAKSEIYSVFFFFFFFSSDYCKCCKSTFRWVTTDCHLVLLSSLIHSHLHARSSYDCKYEDCPHMDAARSCAALVSLHQITRCHISHYYSSSSQQTLQPVEQCMQLRNRLKECKKCLFCFKTGEVGPKSLVPVSSYSPPTSFDQLFCFVYERHVNVSAYITWSEL